MALRWYDTVLDCHDPAAQARWWAETLDWQIAFEDADEAFLVPQWLTPELAQTTPWERRGQALAFVRVPDDKMVKNRMHLDLAPTSSDDRDALIAGLLERGATLADIGQDVDAVSWTVMADPEGNEFCVLSGRDD